MTFDEISELACDALEEELLLVTDGGELYHIQAFLLHLRQEHRLYYLSAPVAQEYIWPRLRENDTLCHLMVSASLNFTLRVSMRYGGHALDNYAEVMANQLGRVGNGSVMDATFKEHVQASTALKKLLVENQWLLFLLTIERDLSKLFARGLFGKEQET